MRRYLWTFVALLAFASALLPGFTARAGYGAIAWDPGTGKAGWIWNEPTEQKAAAGAIRECGASRCRLVIKPMTECAALATTADGKSAGAAARNTKDAAWVAARANCEKRKHGECILRVSECNK